jgi:hypothetical protein
MKKLFSISLWPWAEILAEAQAVGAAAPAAYRARPASQRTSNPLGFKPDPNPSS